MDRYRIAAFLGITLLILAIGTQAASARFATPEGPNAGIDPGDTVFLGERNVNFSAFSDAAKGDPVQMVRIDSGQQVDPIALNNNIATYIRGTAGQYFPVYADGTVDQSKYCRIQDVADSLGRIMIRVSGTDIEPDQNPCRPETIPYRMEEQFLLPEHNLPFNQFQGSWYEYELQGTVKTSTIVNADGTSVSLKDLSANPATADSRYVFCLCDQKAIATGSDAKMVFRITLNNLNYEISYTFGVQDYPPALDLSDTSAECGDDLVLTLQGRPFMLYDINLPVPPTGEDYPLFDGGGWDQKISDYHVRAHPGWDGTVSLNIHIPDDAPATSYTVSATGPDIVQQVTATFYVKKTTMTLSFNEPGHQHAIGDIISLSGTLANAKTSTSIPIYLYVTGPNLPENGAPLTDSSQEVEDGVPSTFTETSYNPVMNLWAYDWDTSKFACDEGTYTVHANLKPIGELNSNYPGATGSINGEVPPAWEIELSSPTLQAKFDEDTGATFARGDYLYSWWYARGMLSSSSSTSSTGHMKWYIFGPNFRYADFNAIFPIGEEGSYGITMERNFTYDLTPGDYFIVYQAPGSNKEFDLLPENNLYYRGSLNYIDRTDGSLSVNLGALDGSSAAGALVDALSSPSIDDLYVMDTFKVEDPVIKIDPIIDPVVGDELIISGTTNLAGKGSAADDTKVDDTLVLSITALNFYDSDRTNTVMKIPVNYTTPDKFNTAIGTRTFSYYEDPIDTSSWYPGTYLITVTCKDVKFKSTSTFELLSEGSQRTETTARPNTDPYLSATPASTVAAAAQTSATTAPASTPTQSPGFAFCTAVAATISGALALRRW